MTSTTPPQITHRRILRIALPLVISNTTIPILGAVDTAVVGQLGDAVTIGAVGIGATILTAIYWMFGFLRMGTTGFVAQAFGRGDQREMSAYLLRVLLIGMAAGLGVILLHGPLFALAFMVSPASGQVERMAQDYMSIRVYSAPAIIALYGVTGWLVGQERTRAVLILQVWMNGLNVLLDIWFVLGLGLGAEGVAWATFIAEWSGLGLGLWLCRCGIWPRLGHDWLQVLNSARLKPMFTVNRDILLRSLMLEVIFVSFMLWGADFGDVTLAANHVLLQFLHITAYGLDGFAFSAETLVGQAIGRQDRALLRRTCWLSILWGLGFCMAFALAFLFFGPQIVIMMAKSPEVQNAAGGYLIFIVVVPLLGLVPWMLDGIFIGATRSKDMRDMMAVSLAIYAISAYILVGQFGNNGLWAALLISFIARGVTLGLRYKRLEQELTLPL
ncbi:MAG: MATE family multidrug resistance protein [Paracoccaceae bacterium]|jgi:MATE family multidrug resistance protein